MTYPQDDLDQADDSLDEQEFLLWKHHKVDRILSEAQAKMRSVMAKEYTDFLRERGSI